MFSVIGRGAVMSLVGLALTAGPAPAAGPAQPDDWPIVLRVENADFATSLRAWVGGVQTLGVMPSWSPDGFSAVSPGSAWLSAAGETRGTSTLFQCATNLVPDASYSATVKVLAPPSPGTLNEDGALVRLDLIPFDMPTCEGSSTIELAYQALILLGPGGSGGWQELRMGFGGWPMTQSLGIRIAYARRDGQPAGSSGVYVDDVTFSGPVAFVKGDMDGGGETDLVLRNALTNEHRVWYLNDEVRTLDRPLVPQPSVAWKAVGVDDFDRNRQNDLLMWNALGGWLDFWRMEGTRRIGDPIPISQVGGGAADPGPDWKPSATADFDRDGNPDIVLRNPTTQAVKIWLMNGTQHTSDLLPTPGQAVDANWEIVGAADMNGDGFVDFLWYNASSGRIVYWLMNAAVERTVGAFTNPMSAGDSNWKVVAMGDYGIGPSTDGIALVKTQDIVWRNDTSGRLVVWYMDRAGSRTGGVFVSPDPPVPATDWTVAGPR